MEKKRYIVTFHFIGSADNLTTIATDDGPDEVASILHKKTGWMQYEGKIINLDSVTYVSVSDRTARRVMEKPISM